MPIGSASLENNGRTLRWSIPALGGQQREEVTPEVRIKEKSVSPAWDNRLYVHEFSGEASTASFESNLGNNTSRVWSYNWNIANNRQRQAAGNYTVAVSVDNPAPAPGSVVNFTITPARAHPYVTGSRTPPIDLEVDIELTGGLRVQETGTISYVPATNRPASVSYSDGVFKIGTLKADDPLPPYSVTLPVTVPSDGDGNEQCLTATLTGNPPPGVGAFDDDISDNLAELCLGGPSAEPIVSGRLDAFTLYPCVGISDAPCDSMNDIRVRAVDGLGRRLGKGTAVIHIDDHRARIYDGMANAVVNNGDTVSWQTRNADPTVTFARVASGVAISYNYSPFNAHVVNWSGVGFGLSASDAQGNQPPPGKVYLRHAFVGIALRKVESPNWLHSWTAPTTTELAPATVPINLYLEFEKLGTYQVKFLAVAKPKGTHGSGSQNCSSTTGGTNDLFCVSETYTFHVGPMADLEVQDGSPSPHVAADRSALTIVAVNNGPDDVSSAQVTGLPTDAEVIHISHGSFDSGVWNIGELKLRDYYPSAGISEPTLVLGADPGDTPRVSIANSTNYEVCIGPKDNPVDLPHTTQGACELVTNASWNSTPVYDYDDSNDTTTLTAQPGTGGVDSDIMPANPRTAIYGGLVAFQWDGMAEGLYSLPVSHYETQQRAGGAVGSGGPAGWGALATVDDAYAGGSGAVGSASATDHNDVQGTFIVDLGIGPGQTRQYRVRAVNAAGVAGPWSFPVVGRTSGAEVTPGVPTGVSASAAGGNSIIVSWQAPEDNGGLPVTGYQVRRSASGAGGWSTVATIADGATMNATDTGIEPGGTRHYQVRARNNAGWGSWSASVSATTLATVPGVPRNFRAIADDANAIELTWAAPSDIGGSAITHYELEWSANGADGWQTLASPGATETAYTHVGLVPGTERHYRIRAVNGATPGEGSWSAVRSATTGAVVPSAPQNLDAEADGKKAITLTWEEPANIGGAAITGYELRVSSGEAGVESTYSRLTSVSGSQLEYSHASGLSPGDTRHYQVRARNSAGWSEWSESATATTQTGVPDAPGSFRATANGSSEIILTWTEPNDEGEAIFHYEVQESEDGSGWRILTFVTGGYHEYADGGLQPGTTKYYRVLARNVNGPGAWSVVRSATTTAGAPDAPTGLTASADGEKAIDLSWGVPNGNGSAITGYRVERSRDGQAPWEQLRSSGTGTTYTDTKDLYPGMTRHYRVAARNSAGWGAWSDVKSGTTTGEPASPPGWVNLLRFTSVGSNSVGLAWSAPPVAEGDPPVTGYEYQVTGRDGADEVRETTGRSASIGGLSAGQHYEFGVRAVNAVGGGPWENLTAYVGGSGSVSVSSTSLTVTEGGSASYTVRLSRTPTGLVLLNLGSPGFTGMSFVNDPYGVAFTPSGWTAPTDADGNECPGLDRYTFRTWNQGVRVEFSIEDDEVPSVDDQGQSANEVGVFTHEVFPLSAGDLCGGTADTVYDPYRVGPGVLVTRRDND